MEFPMGCKNAVLPEPIVENHSVFCLTFDKSARIPYNDKLCLFRALTLHLHGNDKLKKETSKLFAAYQQNMEDVDAAKFQGLCTNDIPTFAPFFVEHILNAVPLIFLRYLRSRLC